MTLKCMSVARSTIFFLLFRFTVGPKRCPKNRLIRIIDFQNMFYSKCLNILIGSIGIFNYFEEYIRIIYI